MTVEASVLKIKDLLTVPPTSVKLQSQSSKQIHIEFFQNPKDKPNPGCCQLVSMIHTSQLEIGLSDLNQLCIILKFIFIAAFTDI